MSSQFHVASPTIDEASVTGAHPNTPSTSKSTSSQTVPHLRSSPRAVSIDPYQSLHDYPFDSDHAFLAGLSQILKHPETPPTQRELDQNPDLVLSAKCFFFNRKFHPQIPVAPQEYKKWIQSIPTADRDTLSDTQISSLSPLPPPPPPPPPIAISSPEPGNATLPNISSISSPPQAPIKNTSSSQPPPEEAPYPTSFAAIVDLITNNKPIPGIEEIPTTVLELGSSKQDKTNKRRKPWEKGGNDTSGSAQQQGEEIVAAGVANDLSASLSGMSLNGPHSESMTTTTAITATPHSTISNEISNGHEGEHQQDTGLLRIIQPNAVPPSGLIARD